jgi:outer membrane protein assembly factor BamE (lipoprotein component of BamABCDE complex)
MMKKRIKITLVLLGVVALAGITILGFSMWSMDGHGFDMGKFEQIQTGMTKQAVQTLLGKPFSTEQPDSNATLWRYGHNLKWCMAQVRFDSSGKVESRVHDH